VNAILFAADNFFKTEIVNLGDEAIESVEEDMDTSPVVLLARSTESVDLARRIKTVEGEIDQLRNNLYKRQLQDSMVTARIRKELDFQANIKKEDRIIMTGLTSKTPMPNQAEEKKHG
jgi:CO dehydrogenase nickel-insertion accessory protein CooC1